MARAGLNWSRAELSKRSGVAEATIAGFESETRSTYPRTVRDLETALRDGGAVFGEAGGSINMGSKS
jgi:transcriptional regulator with XRE-family HTH domain